MITDWLFLYLVMMNNLLRMRYCFVFIIIGLGQSLLFGQGSTKSHPTLMPDTLQQRVLGAFNGSAKVSDSLMLHYAMTYGSFLEVNKLCFSLGAHGDSCLAFDADSLFQSCLSRNPNHYWAHKLYGDFLFRIFELNRFSKRDDFFDVARRMNHHYSLAWQNGVFDAHSLYGLGYYSSLQERYSEAAQWYLKSLDLDSTNALVNYSLGVSYLLGKNSLAAEPYARAAVSMYADSLQRSDAARIAGIALYENGRFEEAYRYYALADSLSPGYLLNQTFLLRSLLQQGKRDEAVEMANVIFKASPHNPDVADRIYELFRIHRHKDLYVRHIQLMIGCHDGDDEALGNLKFHLGKILYVTGQKRKALRIFRQAKAHFKRVLPPNHQVFEALEDMPDR